MKRLFSLLLILLALVNVHPLHAVQQPLLTAPPLGEQWFSITLNDERAGFARQSINRRPDGYEISVDSSVKLTVFGFSREAAIRETYRVNSEFALVSFVVEQTLDGSSMKLAGTAETGGISVTVENAGKSKTSLLKAKGPVYPGAVLNFYPLVKGFAPGRKYKIKTFDSEAQKIKDVVITAVGMETLPVFGEVCRIRNDLYSFVDNDIWIDRQGRTVRESVRDGLVVTEAEDAAASARFLSQTALAKKDLVLDFSLIKAAPPVRDAAALTRLEVAFEGWPSDMTLPEGEGQTAVLRSGTVLTVARTRSFAVAAQSLPAGEMQRYLDGTERIIPEHPEIRALKNTVLADIREQNEAVAALVRWTASNVEGAVTDSQSPVETLKSRKGNCQSHARLYASLARAAGIPTRFVSGLVWVADKGFLYHSWAESHVDGKWLAVDPTFGQIPADLTHIKMFEGDAPDDVAPLARIIGRLRAKILLQEYPPLPGN